MADNEWLKSALLRYGIALPLPLFSRRVSINTETLLFFVLNTFICK